MSDIEYSATTELVKIHVLLKAATARTNQQLQQISDRLNGIEEKLEPPPVRVSTIERQVLSAADTVRDQIAGLAAELDKYKHLYDEQITANDKARGERDAARGERDLAQRGCTTLQQRNAELLRGIGQLQDEALEKDRQIEHLQMMAYRIYEH